MDQLSVNQYLEQAAAEALPDADAHYRALYDCFLSSIPAFLHRTGDIAPSAARPPGFSVNACLYQFGIELGAEHAQTMALFKYKKRLGAWVLKSFICQVAVTQFYTEQGQADTLPGIILAAKEMWANHQKRIQDAACGFAPASDIRVQ